MCTRVIMFNVLCELPVYTQMMKQSLRSHHMVQFIPLLLPCDDPREEGTPSVPLLAPCVPERRPGGSLRCVLVANAAVPWLRGGVWNLSIPPVWFGANGSRFFFGNSPTLPAIKFPNLSRVLG